MMGTNSITTNGITRTFGSPQRLRAAFRDLRTEAELMTEGNVRLELVLPIYKKAWQFYRTNLSRRSDPEKLAGSLLRYVYPPHSSLSISKRMAGIFDDLINQDISVPFIILMILKVMPGYNSKEGNVTNMAGQYERVLSLLEQFAEEGLSENIQPLIDKARDEENKTRLMLFYHISKILTAYDTYANPADTYDLASSMKQERIDLELNGYWNECGGQLERSDFWQIEHALEAGSYFATHWYKDSANTLKGTRYTVFLNEHTSCSLYAYIIHPEMIKHRLKGLKNTDNDHTWYTLPIPSGNAPGGLSLSRMMASKVWRKQINLTRVTASETIDCYDKWFKNCEVINKFEELQYLFYPNLYAVTLTHLYIPTGNESEYYKVPRSAHEGFENIQLGDNVGTMTMGGKTYLVFDEFLLYISTSRSSLKKYGIERVSSIE